MRGARAWRGAARAARQRRRRHLVRRAHREVLAVGAPRAAAHLALELPREVLAAHERLVAREVPNGEVAVDQPEHELPRRRPRGEGDVEVGVAREDVRLEHLRGDARVVSGGRRPRERAGRRAVSAGARRGGEQCGRAAAAARLRRELHALPLLHRLRLRREPQEGAAELLDGGEHRARRLPPDEDRRRAGGQLHAVHRVALVVEHLEHLRRVDERDHPRARVPRPVHRAAGARRHQRLEALDRHRRQLGFARPPLRRRAARRRLHHPGDIARRRLRRGRRRRGRCIERRHEVRVVAAAALPRARAAVSRHQAAGVLRRARDAARQISGARARQAAVVLRRAVGRRAIAGDEHICAQEGARGGFAARSDGSDLWTELALADLADSASAAPVAKKRCSNSL